MPITLIDPTVSPVPYQYSIARRKPFAPAPVIGLVGNGKPTLKRCFVA